MAPHAAPRIASLVPSLTELLCELGLAPWLVARTGYCVHPAALVARVPKVGGTKTVNLAKLARLAPTHVVLNIDENRAETACDIAAMGAERVITHPQAPEDNLALIDQMVDVFGDLPGVTDRAARLRLALQTALARRPSIGHPEHVLYLIWREPWMTVARNTYLSRMLARIGWMTWPPQEGAGQGASRYPVVHGNEPWLADIHRVLLSSEPYAFRAEHIAQAQALCPRAAVQLVDGEALSWYGPRALKGLHLLDGWARAGTDASTLSMPGK